MTRSLLLALALPFAMPALELQPADFTTVPERPGEMRTRQVFQNFRLTLTAKGPGDLLLPGGLRVPLSAAEQRLSIEADGRTVRVNGGAPRQRSLDPGPLAYTPAGIELRNIELTPLPPGAAVGDNLAAAIPNFAKLAGPKGLFVLFLRSADW